MRTRKPRRVRLSLFASASSDLAGAPVKHHSCGTRARADFLWRSYRRQIGPVYGRVVMHLGNLKHHSFKILADESRPWSVADETTRRFTAFEDFGALLDAAGGYFPSLNVGRPPLAALADAYDAAQLARGDTRLAHRYNSTALAA